MPTDSVSVNTLTRAAPAGSAGGYAGGYTQIKDHVRWVRPRRLDGAVQRFETPAGFQGRVDFATFNLPWCRRYALIVVLGVLALAVAEVLPPPDDAGVVGRR